MPAASSPRSASPTSASSSTACCATPATTRGACVHRPPSGGARRRAATAVGDARRGRRAHRRRRHRARRPAPAGRNRRTPGRANPAEAVAVDLPGLAELVDELDAAGNGVVMTMGKGGVGKTTLAAALALALVDRGHEVTLSTTDPAAHLADALADAAPDGLIVERIDPAVETAALHRRGPRGRERPRRGGPRACWKRTCARRAPRR